MTRLSTGIPGLDEKIGGGLIPGTMTVLAGSSGIGKTQFGLQFIGAGTEAEGARGVIFDMTARGDSQNHGDYASRLLTGPFRPKTPNGGSTPTHFLLPGSPSGIISPRLPGGGSV